MKLDQITSCDIHKYAIVTNQSKITSIVHSGHYWSDFWLVMHH